MADVTLPDLREVPHHPAIADISEILTTRNQNKDGAFFRQIVAYFLGQMASTMRAKVHTSTAGTLPVNAYTILLGPSGIGKGKSVGIMEKEFLGGFRQNFDDITMPVLAERRMAVLASQRAGFNGTEESQELDALHKEYEGAGAYIPAFDSVGSMTAVKQLRRKLLIADAGALSLQIDEIGNRIIDSQEAMTGFLELYDTGEMLEKLNKNTAENRRTKYIAGRTPSNLLLFGTPTMLLDGSKQEDLFFQNLETGYARRSLFAWAEPQHAARYLSVSDLYDELVASRQSGNSSAWATTFAHLSDEAMHNWDIEVSRDVEELWIAYQADCKRRAEAYSEYETIRRAELSHRYFKCMKLAGALAFVDRVMVMDRSHLEAAIKLTEESGDAFECLLDREEPHEKLACYIASRRNEVTHADLLKALPFYPKSPGPRNDMISLATAWGYKNHVIIKKNYVEGNVEMLSGEMLEKTDLSAVTLSYSKDWAYQYQGEQVEFDRLDVLATQQDYHWCNHWFDKEHRSDDNTIQGFDMIVLDYDGGLDLDTVHELLADYVYFTHTTKSHTPDSPRFRLVLPLNYRLHLNKEDYKHFIMAVEDWLPFNVKPDEASRKRSQKWATNPNAVCHFSLSTEASPKQLVDALPFIPRTSRAEQHKKQMSELKNLDNLERWLVREYADGTRNNLMYRYAMILAEAGLNYPQLEEKVLSFNRRVSDGLDADELKSTVLVGAAKRITEMQP